MRSNNNNDDLFDSMDVDRDWIHTEVLNRGKKKSNIASNITVVLVLLCTVLLLFIAFKDMFKKDDLTNLDNMDQIAKEQQAKEDSAKAQADLAKKQAEEEAAAKKKAEEEVMVYSVKSGDTLAGIAAQFNVSYTKIAEANALKEPFAIEIGQQLKIPGVKKTTTETTTPTTTDTNKPATTDTTKPSTTTPASTVADSGQTYTVKAGDTLATIALQYGVTYQAMGELNGMKAPYAIEIGQILKVPKK